MARLSSWTFATETMRALGWTLNVTALPAEMMAIELLMIVEVGLVVGVIALNEMAGPVLFRQALQRAGEIEEP